MRQRSVMRICALLLLVCAASPTQAQLVLPPDDDDRPASRLAPMDPKSPWHARFTAAAQALQPTLAQPGGAAWLVHFGGQWLGAADRDRVATVLKDSAGGLRRALTSPSPSEFVVLGWQPPGGDAAYAALADRPEADAIVCWRERGSDAAWPSTAAEAEDSRAHGCVRISYSVRFEPPQWRAFLDTPIQRRD